jgi:hypothetical protein
MAEEHAGQANLLRERAEGRMASKDLPRPAVGTRRAEPTVTQPHDIPEQQIASRNCYPT